MSEVQLHHPVTEAALKAYSRIEDDRLRELTAAMIRHLHALVEEVRLTDKEYETVWTLLKDMAKFTSEERNEYLLLFDLIGVSQLVEDLNHQDQRPDSAVGFALVGPFFRANAPRRNRGESTVLGDTKGDRVRISGRVYDLTSNEPIGGAKLDVWQAATNGLYENQDEDQPDWNLRGRYEADASGTYEIEALLPVPYPVPTDGPVGKLMNAAKRQPNRPAHIHFIVSAPGYETLITQVFKRGDELIDEDPAFTADDNKIGDFRKEDGQWRLQYDFQLKPGVSTMPKPPIP